MTFSLDCLPFVEHFNWLELPTGFSLTDDDDPVQRPESLDVTFSVEQDKDYGEEALVLKIYVDWSSPFDSKYHLAIFHLIMYKFEIISLEKKKIIIVF